jgi:hypothetical protein
LAITARYSINISRHLHAVQADTHTVLFPSSNLDPACFHR